MQLLSKEIMMKALKRLEELLPHNIVLIVGGGGALLLTNQFPLSTADIDAVPKGISSDELGEYVKKVALEMGIPGDWLNPYYSTFTHVLPHDFEKRLVEVYQGDKLIVRALGKEDLLIMKCFAHRQKDIPHREHSIPTRQELLQAYELLQFNAKNVSVKDLVQISEWTRFDPRLAQIVVSFLQNYFLNFNPLEVWQLNQNTKYPQTLCALIDITELAKPALRKSTEWKLWKTCLQHDISPTPLQSFYIALGAINPSRQLAQLGKNLKCYGRWGFYCDELPMTEKISPLKPSTLMKKEQRLRLLRALLEEKKQITINDYMKSLNNKIHRRQAERDLEELPLIRKKGRTRGRVYFLK